VSSTKKPTPELQRILPQVDTIARCLERIESKKPFSLSDLQNNFDLQDIVSINLERAIQASVNIAAMIIAKSQQPAPLEMSESFQVIQRMGYIQESVCERMKKATGFRNLMVHEYEKIDWAIVFQITEHHLVDFKTFVKEILKKFGSA